MADCCRTTEPDLSDAASVGCCGSRGTGPRRFDTFLWGSLLVVAAGLVGHVVASGPGWWRVFSRGCFELMSKAWWGIALGMMAVGVLSQVPKELVGKLLGRGGTLSGMLRATLAGILLDLCNHGILLVAAQLYRRGASLGQTLAFLVASPWNSWSLTFMLISLIGWRWTFVFVGASMGVGILTGLVADLLVERGWLPAHPHAEMYEDAMPWREGVAAAWTSIRPGEGRIKHMLMQGLRESRMILRWIFFGIAVTAAIRAVVPSHVFSHFFGPTLLGLLLTLLAATVMEVCSEGSSPLAADLLHRAEAPGNAFTFLLSGAATDYTEMLVLRETTRSWKATLALPLLTTPQVLCIGWLLNSLS